MRRACVARANRNCAAPTGFFAYEGIALCTMVQGCPAARRRSMLAIVRVLSPCRSDSHGSRTHAFSQCTTSVIRSRASTATQTSLISPRLRRRRSETRRNVLRIQRSIGSTRAAGTAYKFNRSDLMVPFAGVVAQISAPALRRNRRSSDRSMASGGFGVFHHFGNATFVMAGAIARRFNATISGRAREYSRGSKVRSHA
jgi:hypothetical protein